MQIPYRKCFRFWNSLRVENFSLFWNIDEAKREREGSIEYLHHLSLFKPDNLQYCFLDPSLEIPPP